MWRSCELREKCLYLDFSDPHFLAFGLNTEIYSLNIRNQSECWKMRTRKSPNTDSFYPASDYSFHDNVFTNMSPDSKIKF